MIGVAAQSVEVILALRTVDHILTFKTEARCVLLEAPCCCKCDTWRWMDATAHAQGCHVTPFPIDSHLTPFFCVIKRRLPKVEAVKVTGEALVAEVRWVPTKNWMSRRVKGVETVSMPLA